MTDHIIAIVPAPGHEHLGPDIRAYRCYDGPARGQWWERPEYYSDREQTVREDWLIPDHPCLGEPDAIGDFSHPCGPAYALAHLTLQRGIAPEVIVLPVARGT